MTAEQLAEIEARAAAALIDFAGTFLVLKLVEQDVPALIAEVHRQGAVLVAVKTRLSELESHYERVRLTEAGQWLDTVDAAYQRGWDDAGFIQREWEQRLADLRAVVDELRAERKRGAGLGLELSRLLDGLERSEG